MRFRKLAFLFSTVALLSTIAIAQAQPSEAAIEKAKKKKEMDERVVQMLDQTIAEISSLRLSQNRAVVFAMTGDLYWKFDQKRSRELFRNSAGEVVTYNAEFEKEKAEMSMQQGPMVQMEMFDPNDPRSEVLNLIAPRDAELALELMLQTRSASLADAMARAAQQIPGPNGAVAFDAERSKAIQEISLEQRLNMMAAFSDPEKAAKAIKDQLAKGISTNVLSYLQAVFAKDEKRAMDLAGDVVRKFVDTDFAKSSDEFNQGVSFLSYLTRKVVVSPDASTKTFAFTDTQAKEMANKMAATFLMGTPPSFVASGMSRAMTSLEKLVPEKIFQLKQKEAQNKKSVPMVTASVTVPASGMGSGSGIGSGTAPRPPQPQGMGFDPSGTPEEILAAAAKLTDARQKTSAYQIAASRINQITDEARAKKIIDSIPDEKIRANATEQLDNMRVSRLLAAGNLEESRRLIGQLTNKKARVQRLVTLATQFQRKGTEKDREAAASIMTEAKGQINTFPEDEEELGDLMEIIRGYAIIDPDTAFQMVEPIISDFNDSIQASAVLSKYNKRDRSFKKGEMVMKVNGGGSLLPFRYVSQIQLLGSADLERMNVLVDRFQRSDSRTIMKLYVLQGYLRGTQPPRPMM